MRDDATHSVCERPVPRGVETEYGERNSSMLASWSPAQFVGIIVGIVVTVVGFAAVARTGFDTDHIYTPHASVWNLPHSPLMGLIEIGFGVLVILSAVVPGGLRAFMALLGAAALCFGLVVLAEAAPNRLNHWLGVVDRNGWFSVVVGGVLLLAALVSPVFTSHTRRHVVRDEQHVLV